MSKLKAPLPFAFFWNIIAINYLPLLLLNCIRRKKTDQASKYYFTQFGHHLFMPQFYLSNRRSHENWIKNCQWPILKIPGVAAPHSSNANWWINLEMISNICDALCKIWIIYRNYIFTSGISIVTWIRWDTLYLTWSRMKNMRNGSKPSFLFLFLCVSCMQRWPYSLALLYLYNHNKIWAHLTTKLAGKLWRSPLLSPLKMSSSVTTWCLIIAWQTEEQYRPPSTSCSWKDAPSILISYGVKWWNQVL